MSNMNFQDFIDGKVAVWCETREEADAVLRLCEKYGLIKAAKSEFPEDELPVEIALGLHHPYVLSFAYFYGSHYRRDRKWRPVLAKDFLEVKNE